MPSEQPTKRIFIGLCLDKSGSMKRIWKQTIEGFNKEVLKIQEGTAESITEGLKVETYVSLFVFDKTVQRVYEVKSVNHLSEMAEEDFEPKGDTAYYDCINEMVDSLESAAEEADPNNSYHVHVFSDGENTINNNRREETGKRIKEKEAMTDQQGKTGKWMFTFVGCDQNLEAVAQHLNFKRGNIANFSKTAGGTQMAFAACADGMKNYIKCRAKGQNVESFYGGNANEIVDFAAQEQLPDDSSNLKGYKTADRPDGRGTAPTWVSEDARKQAEDARAKLKHTLEQRGLLTSTPSVVQSKTEIKKGK